MIELIIAEMLNDVNANNFPVRLPENTAKPALTYEVVNKRKHKHPTKSQHYTVDFQINIFALSYSQAKQQQSLIENMFDEMSYYKEMVSVSYTYETYVTNVVDLFDFNVNQIAITIQVEYIAD